MSTRVEGGLRVAVVEDDEIERVGRVAVLGDRGVEVAAVGDFAEALGWGDEVWSAIDVLITDAHDASQDWDYFTGVNVVRAARVRRRRGDLRIVVITACATNPVLKLRLAQAGADEMWPLESVRTSGALIAMLRGNHPGPGGTPLDALVRPPLVGPGSRPEAVLDHVRAVGMTEAFEPDLQGSRPGVSHRRSITLRRHIARLSDLRTTPHRSSGGPIRDTSLPTWREIFNYVNDARGAG